MTRQQNMRPTKAAFLGRSIASALVIGGLLAAGFLATPASAEDGGQYGRMSGSNGQM